MLTYVDVQARGYVVEERGLMQLKGLKDMETYWVLQVEP
jgi:hypothetical protein